MIPTKLSITGFLSYRNQVEIDFTALDLTCIAGPNGAGKSSLLDAITWVLFGQARKRDESLINTQSSTAEVSLSFQYEGNTYRVIRENTRGKPARLEFQISSRQEKGENGKPQTVWNTLTEGTLRSTQARIEETLRLDYETFVNASFFLQGKADQFTQKRPSERKIILASILGLEVWEIYRQRTFDKRKSIEGEVVSLDGRLLEIDSELAEEKIRKERLAELQAGLEALSETRIVQEKTLENIKQITATLAEQRRLVNTLSGQINSAQKREQELTARLHSRESERDTHRQFLNQEEAITVRYHSWIRIRESLETWEQIALKFREHEKLREGPRIRIENKRSILIQEHADLKVKQSEIPAIQNTISYLAEDLSNVSTEIQEIQSEIDNRKSCQDQLVHAQENLASARAENPRLKSEMEDLKSRIDQLKAGDGAACPVCGQPLSQEERNSLVDNLEVIGKTLGDKYRTNLVILDRAEREVETLKKEIQRLSNLDDKLLAKKNQENEIHTQIDQQKSQLASWENVDALRLMELERILQEEEFALDARKDLAKVNADLKQIGYDAAEHDSLRRLEQQERKTDEEYHALGRAKAALEPLEDEISDLNTRIDILKTEITVQLAEYNQAEAKLNEAEAQAPDLQKSQRDLLDMKERENQLRLEAGAARQKVIVLDDLKSRRARYISEREILADKVGKYKQLERAFSKDGIPALLIESALPQIEIKANHILDRLSAGSMAVQFITQREYKNKKRQDLMETLDIRISDRVGVRDYELFSGGEAFRVNFAIRLALSEILAQRAGARLQTLVIDEGFGSQDEIGRQRLIEAINTVKADFAKILVITHIDSLKEAFSTQIEVTKTDQGSVVQILR